jgi:hypothetical protein
MLLVIHAGLHKTATSSFQKICRDNAALLSQAGIHYPIRVEDPRNHCSLLWTAANGDMSDFQAFLNAALAAAPPNCHTTLLSGEDFENALIDLGLAGRIESAARSAGFERVHWIFVTRPVNDYVRSLYQELAKHHQVVSMRAIQHAAQSRGVFYSSTPHFDYTYALDFSRFIERFSRSITGSVTTWSMSDFVKGFPGSVLLRHLMSPQAFERFLLHTGIQNRPVQENRSPSLLATRLSYLANALEIFIGPAFIRMRSFTQRASRGLRRRLQVATNVTAIPNVSNSTMPESRVIQYLAYREQRLRGSKALSSHTMPTSVEAPKSLTGQAA